MTATAAPQIRRYDFVEAITADDLVGQTCATLSQLGVRMSPPKVHRLVHRWVEKIRHTGYPFADWIVNGIALQAEHHARVAAALAPLITYADPTGESAVTNVIRDRAC